MVIQKNYQQLKYINIQLLDIHYLRIVNLMSQKAIMIVLGKGGIV